MKPESIVDGLNAAEGMLFEVEKDLYVLGNALKLNISLILVPAAIRNAMAVP